MSEQEKWEQFLTPERTRDRLISASMFITAFELLKESIIDQLRSFYSIGIDENGAILSRDYQIKVLSRSKSQLYASLAWLLEHGVIDDDDIASFEQVKAVRNTIAHELPALVFGQVEDSLIERFNQVFELLRKIEVWWVANLEIPTNPDFDGAEIDESGIVPGRVLILQIMLEVVAGNVELLEHYRRAKR